MELSTWWTLLAASWAISLSPGAGAVAAMNSGLTYGFRRGYITTFGLILGILTQLLLVGFGLGALVASSNTAFNVVKWCGVVYLIWLGVQSWRSPLRPVLANTEHSERESASRMITKAWLLNVANPKGTVFLLAVVPQFISLSAPLLSQYIIIGLTLALTDLIVMAGYTALAAHVLKALRSPKHVQVLNRFFGSLFVLAGLSLALFRRSA